MYDDVNVCVQEDERAETLAKAVIGYMYNRYMCGVCVCVQEKERAETLAKALQIKLDKMSSSEVCSSRGAAVSHVSNLC
jgi:hypothetical protein